MTASYSSPTKGSPLGLGPLAISMQGFLQCIRNMGLLVGQGRLRVATCYHIYVTSVLTPVQLSAVALESRSKAAYKDDSLTHSSSSSSTSSSSSSSSSSASAGSSSDNAVNSSSAVATSSQDPPSSWTATPMTFPVFLSALLRVANVRYHTQPRLAHRLSLLLMRDLDKASACDPLHLRRALSQSDVEAVYRMRHVQLASVFLFFASAPSSLTESVVVPPLPFTNVHATPVVAFMYHVMTARPMLHPITIPGHAGLVLRAGQGRHFLSSSTSTPLSHNVHHQGRLSSEGVNDAAFAKLYDATLSFAAFLRIIDVAAVTLGSHKRPMQDPSEPVAVTSSAAVVNANTATSSSSSSSSSSSLSVNATELTEHESRARYIFLSAVKATLPTTPSTPDALAQCLDRYTDGTLRCSEPPATLIPLCLCTFPLHQLQYLDPGSDIFLAQYQCLRYVECIPSFPHYMSHVSCILWFSLPFPSPAPLTMTMSFSEFQEAVAALSVRGVCSTELSILCTCIDSPKSLSIEVLTDYLTY